MSLTAHQEAGQRGFSLVELLVVMGIGAVLASLLLPATQQAREAARRMQCRNNLRQMGIAIHEYADVQGCLPLGRVPIYDPRFAGTNPPCTARFNDKSLLVSLLPFLEQSQLFNAVNHDLSVFSLENTTLHTSFIELFACPSDFAAGYAVAVNPAQFAPMAPDSPNGPWRVSRTSYSACFGTFPVLSMPGFFPNCTVPAPLISQNDGSFNDLRPIPLSAVSDGLSHTIFVSEKATAVFDEVESLWGSLIPRHGWYADGDFGSTLFVTFYPPNAFRRTGPLTQWPWLYGASSLHSGGVNVLMGDGAVRLVNENIDSWPLDSRTGMPVGARRNAGGWWENLPSPGVWQALGTRSGGESIHNSF